MLRRRVRTELLRSCRATSSSSKRLDLDEFVGKRLRATAKELSVEVLPALKVLSESLGLLRQSPALKNWSASDWLVGLSVLAQYKTQQRAGGIHNEAHKKPLVMDSVLLSKLLRYVRVCDAVYASSIASFCEEAGVTRDRVLRAHPGGVVSPRCIILADHEHRELVLVVRGTASLLDFCTDLCLQNEPFLDGQGHRGMVHATTWLVRHLRNDLQKLSEKYPDYKLVATGHSLGAAVAAMSVMQLKEDFPDIHCYAFGTPACMTRELATGSYDLVTSVVNGYDCVPRLHQHSLLKLQDEISRFDWRTALRHMVSEEIRKQKLAVEKQQRVKLEEVQTALRKMDHLQLKKRTSEASAKLDEVKKFASNNIKEFASDVDSLLAGKLDAAFSVFKTDKLSLEHVSFIKNLLKLEDVKKGDSFWWKRMDEIIVALERMSAAVNKPEELECVLVELKEVLHKTSEGTKKLLKSDDDPESTQLQLFRSRIDGVIDKTRASLKTRISEQVSKVSTAVTSNVKNYVDTIKEETEALSSIVQEELDDVAGKISQNLPFLVGMKCENESGADKSTLDKKDKKDRLGDFFADSDPSERIEGESNEEAEQEWEEHKQDQKQSEEDNMLRHDPLFPPGRILYLNRVIAPGPSLKPDDGVGIKTLGNSHKIPDVVEFVEVATDEFGRVVLSNRMLLDHLCTDYERVLQSQAKILERAP
ncbi:Alpha/Beta hydrolase fold [Phytophthora cactorum]|nr:Alpha/Beta hydrolase fold [Phytophthora cactorum]